MKKTLLFVGAFAVVLLGASSAHAADDVMLEELEVSETYAAFTQDGSEYVDREAVIVEDMVLMCGENATVTISLAARGAKQYLLSNDMSLNTAVWEPMDGSVSVDWKVDAEAGTTSVYYMFKSLHNNMTGLRTLNINLGDYDPCGVGGSGDMEVLGHSPYDGSIEVVDMVEDGDLIRGEHYATVYLVEDGVRRPFQNDEIFDTWYNHKDDVREVTDATLSALQMGAPMLPKPAGKLVRTESIDGIYFVKDNGGDGRLMKLSGESHAEAIYGENWEENVIDLDITLFARFAR